MQSNARRWLTRLAHLGSKRTQQRHQRNRVLEFGEQRGGQTQVAQSIRLLLQESAASGRLGEATLAADEVKLHVY